MTRTAPWPTALALLLLSAPGLRADELLLKNGEALVGPTTRKGDHYVVETLDGPVKVPIQDVERHRTEAELRDALELIAMRSGAGSAHAQLELARVARSWGLYDEMWCYLGKVLRSNKDSDVIQRRAREFMAGLEREVLPKKWRDARTEIKVRELLYRLRNKVPRAKLATVEELLAQLPEADDHLRKRARRVTSALQRRASVTALARRPTEGNETFVYRTAILDPAPDVRRAAVDVSKELGRTQAAIEYLAPGLVHDNANYRIRTAEAFAEFGDAAALPLLVAAGPTAGMMRKALPGGATRANFSQIQQIAYVRDFDVEVAQASFIADPKVDVLQAGVVLDVTVAAVNTRRIQIVRAYRDAIAKLAGEDPGGDPDKWAAWLAKREQDQKAVRKG